MRKQFRDLNLEQLIARNDWNDAVRRLKRAIARNENPISLAWRREEVYNAWKKFRNAMGPRW